MKRTKLEDGNTFSLTNTKRSIYLRINFNEQMVEWEYMEELSLPKNLTHKIKKQDIISLDYGLFDDHTNLDEIMLGFTILHNNGSLSIVAPSKEVFFNWVEGLLKFADHVN